MYSCVSWAFPREEIQPKKKAKRSKSNQSASRASMVQGSVRAANIIVARSTNVQTPSVLRRFRNMQTHSVQKSVPRRTPSVQCLNFTSEARRCMGGSPGDTSSNKTN